MQLVNMCRHIIYFKAEAAEHATAAGLGDAKYGGGGYPGDEYGCRFRCCERGDFGRCRRCCSYVGEAPEKGN